MENGNDKPIIELAPSKDLLSLYMRNLDKMLESVSDDNLYTCLLNSIRLGKNLLPVKYLSLKKKAQELLADTSTYRGNRDIRVSISGEYILSSSDETGAMRYTGKNEEGVKDGMADIITQQSTKIIPKIEPIEDEIRNALIEVGIVKTKKLNFDDIFDQRIKNSYDKYEKGG